MHESLKPTSSGMLRSYIFLMVSAAMWMASPLRFMAAIRGIMASHLAIERTQICRKEEEEWLVQHPTRCHDTNLIWTVFGWVAAGHA